MSSLDKLRTIAKAKFSDKSNLGNWYKERLSICEDCPFNSKNKKDLSIKEKAFVIANLGKPTCLACGCEIDAKASVRTEECGLAKINKEPLWGKLPEIEGIDFSDLKIENLSSDKVNMSTEGNEIVLDYGDIAKKSDTSVDISLKSKKEEIKSLTARSGCSCTVPTPVKNGDTYFVNISYDSKRVGNFSRVITMLLKLDEVERQLKVKITGTVLN